MTKILSNAQNLQVIFEDNHLIIINKRVGDIVQGDKTGDKALSDVVKEYLKEKYQKPGEVFLGVIHRLDRPTSGLVIFAKTSKALTRMNESFKNRTTQKIYWAIVKNNTPFSQDTLTHFLTRNSKNNTSKAFSKEVPESKMAVLDYKILRKIDNYSLLEIHLHTGRHHQIRAQLAFIGCPIKGDLKYGFNRSNPDAGICLHAYSIEFSHPVTKEILKFTADVSGDIWGKF
jgi:23S rRNA pseudouridine1911/1915/1917 synthase